MEGEARSLPLCGEDAARFARRAAPPSRRRRRRVRAEDVIAGAATKELCAFSAAMARALRRLFHLVLFCPLSKGLQVRGAWTGSGSINQSINQSGFGLFFPTCKLEMIHASMHTLVFAGGPGIAWQQSMMFPPLA